MSPRLLDLFCGAGGAAMGYHRAGFEVVGVDLYPQKNYPFEFHQADAMTYPLEGFDVIHASPPCQHYSVSTPAERKHLHPDLIADLRHKLQGYIYIIENVPGAPLVDPIVLCGSSFGLRVRRHRKFESSVGLEGLACQHKEQGQPVGVYGGGTGTGQKRGRKVMSSAEAMEVMGMPWANRKECNEAIPPAYTEWLGKQLMAVLHG